MSPKSNLADSLIDTGEMISILMNSLSTLLGQSRHALVTKASAAQSSMQPSVQLNGCHWW